MREDFFIRVGKNILDNIAKDILAGKHSNYSTQYVMTTTAKLVNKPVRLTELLRLWISVYFSTYTKKLSVFNYCWILLMK